MKVFVIATIFASASASCSNSCSQHGTCGEHDICECDPNWMGGDCSLAKCPYGASWSANVDGNAYAECSSRGECDRKTGQCKCQPGYTGASCQRTECVDHCSGHGVCEAPITLGSRVPVTEQQSCKCDNGWTGINCGQRTCPHGDDPLTKTNYDANLKKAITQTDEVQTIRISSAHVQAFSVDTFTLTYTLPDSEEAFTTYPLNQFGLTSGKIERALENLPNGVLLNVTVGAVTTVTSAPNFHNTFAVTFVANTGDQKMLTVNSKGCKVAGCIPQYFGCSGTNGAGCTVTYTETKKGTKEHVECAGRGICDRETARCSCFKGFYGDACDHQSTLA